MVKVRGQNSNRSTVKQTAEIGQKILGYVHTYPGLFENGAFRPRIHRNGHTYPHVSGAFWKRLGPKTELFENAPESGSFENGGFGSGSFLRVNMVSGSFLPLFPRRSKMACPCDKYCFTCMCSLVAETSSSSSFFFKGPVAFENRTEDGCCCLQKQLYLVVYSGEGRVFFLFHFCFVFCLCFILPLEPFFYHLPPWYVHSFLGGQARDAVQKNDTRKQRKQTKKVRFELEASSSLSTYMWNTEAVTFRWRHVSLDQSTSVWTGSPDWRTIRADTPKRIFSKTDLFENVYVCT